MGKLRIKRKGRVKWSVIPWEKRKGKNLKEREELKREKEIARKRRRLNK